MADEARDRSEYQREYYQRRREELSQQRKERYQDDKAYRQEILDRVREYRAERRAERDRLRAEGALPLPQPRGPRPPLRVSLNGVMTVAYTVGGMAELLQRSVDVINYWARIGLLPATPYRSPRGDRLYTEGMVMIVKIALNKRGRVAADDREFTREVRQGWEGLGIASKIKAIDKRKRKR